MEDLKRKWPPYEFVDMSSIEPSEEDKYELLKKRRKIDLDKKDSEIELLKKKVSDLEKRNDDSQVLTESMNERLLDRVKNAEEKAEIIQKNNAHFVNLTHPDNMHEDSGKRDALLNALKDDINGDSLVEYEEKHIFTVTRLCKKGEPIQDGILLNNKTDFISKFLGPPNFLCIRCEKSVANVSYKTDSNINFPFQIHAERNRNNSLMRILKPNGFTAKVNKPTLCQGCVIKYKIPYTTYEDTSSQSEAAKNSSSSKN
tara:strand:+ start:3249 stop:4019 length:771 start_codon:yes stop_codon:yes gene_type:complete